MNPFERQKRNTLFAFFLLIPFCLYAQKFNLAASYPNGKKLQANDVLLLNDTCTFFVQYEGGGNVKFKSCEWIYACQFTDLEYKTLKSEKNINSWGVKLDESIKDYSATQLNRILIESENSIYFSAIIRLNGTTETNENVSLEFPIYLNVLPNIPHVSFIDLVNIGQFDEQYGDYFNATMLASFSIDRTDSYLVESLPMGGIYPTIWYIDFNDKISEKELELAEYDTNFKFTAINQFGSVISTNEFNFHNEALEALGNLVSIDEVLSENNSIILFPNPVKDFIYVRGKTDKIKKIQVIDSQGKIVDNLSYLPNQIDFTSYPKGLYFIKCITGTENEHVYKVIKN